MMWRLVVLLIVALTSAANAQYAGPLHSAEDIERFRKYQGPGRSAQDGWRDLFLGQRLNRAMAVNAKGAWGVSYGATSEQAAIESAMRSCTEQVKRSKGTDECRLYAVNMRIVYPGAEFGLPYYDHGIGDFTSREGYFVYGPRRAKGVLVWQHGYSGRCNDQRMNAAWSVVTRFNLEGWDVLRFDRDPCLDGDIDWALSRLTESVPKLRSAGYRKIVLAGQSRGAWQSIEFLAKGAVPIDGVLSISAARHGEATSRATLVAPEDWRRMIRAIKPGPVAFAAVFFAWDGYVPEAVQQTAFAREELTAKGIGNTVIYEDGEDVVPLRDGKRNGHGGAGSGVFTKRYGDCLIRFIETREKNGACR